MTANPEFIGRPADEFRRRWEQIAATGYCRRPVRLTGRSIEVDAETGEVLRRYSTEGEPDGVLLVACNNRRASVCPSCSGKYHRDAWQLVAAGLRGGKGVSPTIAEHPTIFATFTAPSFGPVHAVRHDDGGKSQPCRPRRAGGNCTHGHSTACWVAHHDREDVLGQPLCVKCFDYEGLVIWNAGVSELWRRTIIYLKRHVAAASGLTVRELRESLRISYFKVVEYQARGAVHIHAVMRLDDAEGGVPRQAFDVGLLNEALRKATPEVVVRIEGQNHSWDVRWGDQLDLKVVGVDDAHREASAGYLAKYATKSIDQFGHIERFQSERDLDVIVANDHIAELCRTAWRLGGDPCLSDLSLRRWAHALGFRGHWSSKSRHYSTTFKALRDARRNHARQAGLHSDEDVPVTVEALGSWQYAGMGHGRAGAIEGGSTDE